MRRRPRYHRGVMLSRWARKLRKPALDPARPQRVSQQFDIGHGYAAYHDACRARLGRDREAALASAADSPPFAGFEHLPVMDFGTATGLRQEIESRFSLTSVKKDKPELAGYDIADEPFRDRLIGAALGPGVEDRVVRHFGCEYRVHWFQVTRTEAGGGTASFLWHCDRGPSAHLKLIVYLDDSAEHGGNTEFLDLEASEALTRIGYLYGPTATRSADLTRLLAPEGIAYRPESRPMAPGDGILFQPTKILHRGVSPTRGHRTALTLCLIPSVVPWQRALGDGGMFDLRREEKWHVDALSLLPSPKSGEAALGSHLDLRPPVS